MYYTMYYLCDRRQLADYVGTCQRCMSVDGRHMDTHGSSNLSRVLSAEAAKTVVRAFISSRVDYCNSILFGISDNLLQRLQAI